MQNDQIQRMRARFPALSSGLKILQLLLKSAPSVKLRKLLKERS